MGQSACKKSNISFMSKNILKIGCLSVGSHAIKNTLPAIKKINTFKLIAIHTRSNNNKQLSKKFNCKVFNDVDKLLGIKEIGAIYISSPNSLHYSMAKKAMLMKKNIIIEKPATINLYQARQLNILAKKSKLVIMEALMYKFHLQFKEVKNILRKERITKVVSTFGFPHLNKNNIRYKPELGGGALLDAGYYPISSILYLFNSKPQIISSNYKQGKFAVDISGNARFKIKGGVECFTHWYFGGKYKNQIELNTDNQKIVVERAFSKSPDLITKINYFKKNILINSHEIREDNHFINMFKYFHKLCFGELQQETERMNILELAKIIEKVKKKRIYSCN